MSQTWMFLNHKKCHRSFFMFFTCTINIITCVYPFTHNNLLLPNHKNALIVFFVSCPLSMLTYMCIHSHIRNCSLLIRHTFKTFFFFFFCFYFKKLLNLKFLIFFFFFLLLKIFFFLIKKLLKIFFFFSIGFIVMKPWTSQFQLMSWKWRSLKCDMNYFFHWDGNLNVTILINVMTQIFQFNSRDMKF